MNSFGELRHSLTIQQPGSAAKDSYGAMSEPFTTVLTVFGSVKQLSGKEGYMAAQMAAEVSHLLRIRYDSALSAIDPSWQVLFGSRVCDVVRAANLSEQDREIELQVRERIE